MNDLLKNEPVKIVERALNLFNRNIKIQVLENTAKTALDASKSLKCEIGAIVKSLVLRKDKTFFLCLVSGDKRCSLNKLKKISEKKNVRMASADEVKSQTGYTIGGVSPVGHINDIPIFVDNSLSRFKDIFAAAGHPNAIFKINYEKLIQITKGDVKDITE